LASAAQEAIDFLLELVTGDTEALAIEEGEEDEDAVVDEAAEEVEAASDGAVTAEDYAKNASSPSTSAAGDTVFARVFNKTKLDLLNEAKTNLNAFTRQAIKQALELVEELDALMLEIEAEALKIQVAYAAGLIVPPDRREVEELRGAAQTVKNETDNAVVDLESAKARRAAANRAVVGNESTGSVAGLNPVSGRFVEEQSGVPQSNRSDPLPVNLSLAASSPNDGNVERESQSRGRSAESMSAATKALKGSVLDKISYIAICAAIAGIGTNAENTGKALDLFDRLKGIVDNILLSLTPGFQNSLKDQLQESVIDAIKNIGGALQGKLEAFDQWLALGIPELPTFVATVNAIGDQPNSLPVLESLAAQCGLSLESFCDFQGLMEIALALDAELGELFDRGPGFARVRMVVQAPEATEIRPPAVLPDLEANMFLVGALEGTTRVDGVTPDATHVITRFPRANVRSEINAPVPSLSGTVAEDVGIGDDTILVAGLPTNIATLGSVTINPGAPAQQVLRYSAHEPDGVDTRFTLIDKPTAIAIVPTAVSVTGEQRNTFEGAFEPNRAIKGGEGKLSLAGDGEVRQDLKYSSSTFDPDTGEYTFEIDTATTPLLPLPVPEHKFLLLCRPHQTAKQIMYKDMGFGAMLQTGKRFKITNGGAIYALKDVQNKTVNPPVWEIDPTFDWSANGTYVVDPIGDYEGSGPYRLCVGADSIPYAVEELGTDILGNYLLLEWVHHGGDQERVTLARVLKQQPPGQSTTRLKLDRRQKDDIGVADLLPGETAAISGRVILDGGAATTTIGSVTEEVSGVGGFVGGPFSQVITSVAPIVRGDEQLMPGGGAQIDVQSGRTMFTTRVTSTSNFNKKFGYQLPQMNGTVTRGPVTTTRAGFYTTGELKLLNGTGTKFRTDLKLGDHLFIEGAGILKIIEIQDDTTLIVDTVIGATGTLDYYMCAPFGSNQGMSFTVHLQPREERDFTAITRVNEPDSPYFDLTLTSPTSFAHSLQEPEVPTTVKTLPEKEFSDFRASFSALATRPPETTRFDGTIVPPGTELVRAVFDDPDAEPLFSALVQGATKFHTQAGNVVPCAPPNALDGDVYTFSVAANPLVYPLEDGDIIEVETLGSVFDMLADLFDGDWNLPFDDSMAAILDALKLLESKICRILAGRPMDVSITVLSLIAASASARLLVLFPIRITLSALILGLSGSKVIDSSLDTFKASGMDTATRALEDGDIIAVAQLQPGTATTEGNVIQALDDFYEVVIEPVKLKLLDNVKAYVRGQELDKEILATNRRPYKEVAGDKLSREKEAAENMSADVEIATS
jgi:hypothetical protein